MANAITIEVFSDYICPWCYLSTPLIKQLEAEEDVNIRFAHYPLHPDIPVNGRALKDLYKGDRADSARAFQQQMRGMMDSAGLPYGKREMIWNSRLAQECAAWAVTREGGDRIHDRLFHAYFVDNDNIGDIDVLCRLVAEIGLDAAEARVAMTERSFASSVDKDWQQARDMGLTGVPTFVSGDLWVMGCQPIEVLMRFVNRLRETNT